MSKESHMAKRLPRYRERPEGHSVPVILQLSKELLIEAVNLARAREHLVPIPIEDCTVEASVPGGGDYSGMTIDIGTKDSPILIRWRTEV
jgi:hypothetical protein